MRWALVVMVICACKSDRERDCDQIRSLFPKDLPRRYYESTNAKSPRDVLAKTKWLDADVQAAVDEFLGGEVLGGTGWTAYKPYSTEAPVPHTPRLMELCDIEPSRPR